MYRLPFVLASALGACLMVGCATTAPAAPAATSADTVQAAPTPSPTADITSISTAYLTAYNVMITTTGPLITKENAARIGSNSLLSALNAEAAAYTTFGTAIAAIDATAFPTAQQDMRAVSASLAAVENGYGLLAANYADVTNYNGVFSTLTTAQAQFASANALLFSDLNLVFATPAA